MLAKTLSFFAIALLIFSCKKDKPTFQEIDFQVSLIDNGYLANWSKSDLGFFEGYRIYFSDQPFDHLTPIQLDSVPYTLVGDQDLDSKEIIIGHNHPEMYFMLAVLSQNRSANSEMVKVETPILSTFDFRASQVIHYPEKNALYLYQSNPPLLVYYEYVENEVKATKVLDQSMTNATVADNGFGEEFYLTRNTPAVSIYDANTLEKKTTFYASENIKLIITNGKGLLALRPIDGNSPTQILDRSGIMWKLCTMVGLDTRN